MAFKLKRDVAAEEPAEAAEAAAAEAGEAVQTEAVPAPEESATGTPAGLDAASSERILAARRLRAVFFFLALAGALCFLAVMGMQGWEIYGYGKPPSVWLPK
jgi:hypothetical protein